MEQKRTLWIIVAAGVFLLVVLGAAYVFYAPTAGSNPPSIARSTPNQSQPSNTGWTQVPTGNTNLTPAPTIGQEPVPIPPVQNEMHTNELTVISDNTVIYDLNKNATASSGTTIDLNALRVASEALNNNGSESLPPPQAPQNINITVNVPEKDLPPPPAPKAPVPPTDESKTVKVAKQDAPKPASKASSVVEKKAAPVSAPAASKKAEPAVAKVAEKKVDQYWVQAAAYSTKKTAENARTVLDDNKIPADIFTYKDARGKVFYRVRVGPYTTKSEAEYWRTRIVKINEFASGESYITLN